MPDKNSSMQKNILSQSLKYKIYVNKSDNLLSWMTYYSKYWYTWSFLLEVMHILMMQSTDIKSRF